MMNFPMPLHVTDQNVTPTDATMCVKNVRKKLKLHLQKKFKTKGKWIK